MDEFTTYKPILSAIKREYEMMLSQNREKIRKLEPLKQVLITTTEQCQLKLDELKSKDKPGTSLFTYYRCRVEDSISHQICQVSLTFVLQGC